MLLDPEINVATLGTHVPAEPALVQQCHDATERAGDLQKAIDLTAATEKRPEGQGIPPPADMSYQGGGGGHQHLLSFLDGGATGAAEAAARPAYRHSDPQCNRVYTESEARHNDYKRWSMNYKDANVGRASLTKVEADDKLERNSCWSDQGDTKRKCSH